MQVIVLVGFQVAAGEITRCLQGAVFLVGAGVLTRSSPNRVNKQALKALAPFSQSLRRRATSQYPWVKVGIREQR